MVAYERRSLSPTTPNAESIVAMDMRQSLRGTEGKHSCQALGGSQRATA